jgi:hypothetical protein
MLDVSALSENASSPRSLSPETVLSLLVDGGIRLEGLIPWSSNATFLVTLQQGTLEALAVYKPRRGERPLWDFAQGTLCLREVAAYRVSEALGWALVPPTVLRDGPYGIGSLQFFVTADPDENYFTFRDHLPQAVARLALFDAVTNNADRKAGHCLLDGQGHMWAIDNALTFHVEPKLRTVIWDLAGEPIPPLLLDELRRLQAALEEEDQLWAGLYELLTEEEMTALVRRLRRLLRHRRFPEPGDGRSVPWPLV